MTFVKFLQILEKYYKPLIEPYYGKSTTGKATRPDFVRALFIAATTGHDNDLFPNASLPQKIINGKRHVSDNIIKKILSDTDSERFNDFLDRLVSADSIKRLRNDLGIDTEDLSIPHEYILNMFLSYLEKLMSEEKTKHYKKPVNPFPDTNTGKTRAWRYVRSYKRTSPMTTYTNENERLISKGTTAEHSFSHGIPQVVTYYNYSLYRSFFE